MSEIVKDIDLDVYNYINSLNGDDNIDLLYVRTNNELDKSNVFFTVDLSNMAYNLSRIALNNNDFAALMLDVTLNYLNNKRESIPQFESFLKELKDNIHE